MKYDHLVKHNGIYYNAGEEVPDSASSIPSDNVETKEIQYKRSDISRMNKESLVALATELSIAFDDETSGSTLKEAIIAKLGL